MNKQQMDERRDSRRGVLKFYAVICALMFFVGAPVHYFLEDSAFGFYSAITLLTILVVIFVITEVRDLIQRQVVDD